MRLTRLKIILMFMILLFVVVASRYYNYHGYTKGIVVSQQISSSIMDIAYLLFLLLSLLPLFIELGLIIFLIKNRREIVNLIKDLLSNKGKAPQQKRRNLLVQIIAWSLALVFLALYNINKNVLNPVSIENINSTLPLQPFQSTILNSTYFQQSATVAFTVLNNSLLIAFIVLFSVFLSIVFWAFYTREKDHGLEYNSPEKQLEHVIVTTLSNLKNTTQVHHNDARSIIIKCYNDMCNIISKAGRRPKTYETAREFEKACLSVFPWIPMKPLHELTLLFEETLYSNHTIDDDKVNIALNSLKEINEAMVVRNANS